MEPLDNPWTAVRSALDAARRLNEVVDIQSDSMASMLRGRLRKVDRDTLVELKRELQAFNASTRKWKD